MNKNLKTVAIVAIAAALVIVVIWVVRDVIVHHQIVRNCPDGSHPTIDTREFTTRYWVYSAKLDASVGEKAKISAQLDPKLLVQVSEALQEANELRHYIVVGYNSCAVSQKEFSQIEARFEAMESLAHDIDAILSKPSLTGDEAARFQRLINQYAELARRSGSQ